ncbi:hypothetical protein BZY71_07695 [Leclercia adecarboxylata]|nr:hypothetical protein BZY71_07695 [Leclercia adecarboxylata]
MCSRDVKRHLLHPQKAREENVRTARDRGINAVQLLQTRLNRPQALVLKLLLKGKEIKDGSVSNAMRHAARVALNR